jgi:hypothetical protein
MSAQHVNPKRIIFYLFALTSITQLGFVLYISIFTDISHNLGITASQV